MFSCKAIEVLSKYTRHGSHLNFENCDDSLQVGAEFIGK